MRNGDWMVTYTHKKFWPLDPHCDDVCIEDIAHALSLICRFGGHCREFYSVAQHSILVAGLVAMVEPEFTLEALMHDAAEAYLGDFIRPIKRMVPELSLWEVRVMGAIRRGFGLKDHGAKTIKWADDCLLRSEHAQIINDGREWPTDRMDGLDVVIIPMSPIAAESEFLRNFKLWSNGS